MNIADAFTERAIDTFGVTVGGEQEDELRRVVQLVCQENEVELNENEESLAMLCFVAGRAYQADFVPMTMPISMTPEMISEFMEYLRTKGES